MSIITVSTLGILSIAYDGGAPLPNESYILGAPDGGRWTVLFNGTTGAVTVTSGATGDVVHPSFFDPNSVEWALTVDNQGVLYLTQAAGPIIFSPVGNEQYKFETGKMAEGYMIFTYQSGTLTPATTYKTKSFALPQPNPILIDANGFPTDPIFIELGKFYKFILALPNSVGPPTDIVFTWDGVNGGALVNRANPTEFSAQSIRALFLSETMFRINGDQRLSFLLGRRVKCIDATTLYGTITTPPSFDGNMTAVTIALDGGSLSAALAQVYVGMLRPGKSGMPSRVLVGNRIKLNGGLVVPVASGLNLLPAGIIIPYANSNVPAGWLRCDGASLLRASYTSLFTAIGTAFGTVDGTHFNIPDLRGRPPLGLDNLGGAALANRVTAASLDGGNAHAMGGVGGEETHLLSLTETPAHNHQKTLSSGALSNSDEAGATNTTSAERTDFAVRNAGGGGVHSNTPPWEALNYLIYAQI